MARSCSALHAHASFLLGPGCGVLCLLGSVAASLATAARATRKLCPQHGRSVTQRRRDVRGQVLRQMSPSWPGGRLAESPRGRRRIRASAPASRPRDSRRHRAVPAYSRPPAPLGPSGQRGYAAQEMRRGASGRNTGFSRRGWEADPRGTRPRRRAPRRGTPSSDGGASASNRRIDSAASDSSSRVASITAISSSCDNRRSKRSRSA